MLDNMYNNVQNTDATVCMPATADAQTNSTPFSVKDILNIGDANDGYLNCYIDE